MVRSRSAPQRASRLFPNDLDERSLSTSAVPFAIEDLLPWPKVQLPFRDGDDDFAAHHLAFEVRIRVIFASVVVTVLTGGFVGGELF
jgi:hypothetical protein